VSRQALEAVGLRARIVTNIDGRNYYACADAATGRDLRDEEVKTRLNQARTNETHPGGEVNVCVLPTGEVERQLESNAELDPVPVLGYIHSVRRVRRGKRGKKQGLSLVRWIVLDSGATVSLLQNLAFLRHYDNLNLEMVLQAANGATITSNTVVHVRPGTG